MSLLEQITDLLGIERYGKSSKTNRGEMVKSLGEKMIADYFFSNNIRYEYEKPVRTFPILGKKIARPDFYLAEYSIYVEYWGMAGIHNGTKRAEYRKIMDWKLEKYQRYGIRVISLYSEDLRDLDSNFKRKFKKLTGEELSLRKSH